MSKARRSVEDRYAEKFQRRGDGECWPWTAAIAEGYGWMGVPWQRRPEPAHRVGWRLLHGPIPPGGTIDHTCHNEDPDCPGGECPHRACQNPAHWRLTTRGKNVLAGKGATAVNAVKTHCDAGHLFDAANTYVRPDGYRDCRACKASRQAAYLARKKA